MFKTSTERRFTARCKAFVPVNGGHREEPFKANFRLLDSERVEDFDLTTKVGTDDFLRAVIVDLDEIGDAEGNPMPYSEELRDQIINDPPARLALIRGYFDNVGKGRKGN